MTNTSGRPECVVRRRRAGRPQSRTRLRTDRTAPRADPGNADPGTADPTATGHGGLRVADVVAAGAIVGVDESDLVRGLLAAVVAARPALVGSTSLAAVLDLTATPEAASGAFTVRLFGGEHHRTTGGFGGPRGLHAVTATQCDVALVGGRLVGDAVWVPADARPERLALLLAARTAYVVLAPSDATAVRPDETPLARLTDFAGVIEVAAALLPCRRFDAA